MTFSELSDLNVHLNVASRSDGAQQRPSAVTATIMGHSAIQTFSQTSHGLPAAAAVRTRVQAVVLDPEVVFVASLLKADAPALLASFQCDVSLQTEEDSSQSMRAILRELKVQACPFIRNKEEQTITTVGLSWAQSTQSYA